jgi:hypothetical protein
MIELIYAATNSPLVMSLVAVTLGATAMLLVFVAVLEREVAWSWLSIFLFLMTFSAIGLALVRTEPDPNILRALQVAVRAVYILTAGFCLVLIGWISLKIMQMRKQAHR